MVVYKLIAFNIIPYNAQPSSIHRMNHYILQFLLSKSRDERISEALISSNKQEFKRLWGFPAGVIRMKRIYPRHDRSYSNVFFFLVWYACYLL